MTNIDMSQEDICALFGPRFDKDKCKYKSQTIVEFQIIVVEVCMWCSRGKQWDQSELGCLCISSLQETINFGEIGESKTK
jgi:hypothetical protein